MPRHVITQSELKQLLHYNSDTGIFTSLVNLNKWKIGCIPGSTERGYWVIKINNFRYRAHRLAWLYMFGNWPHGELDHIDGCKMNNRLSNLRDTSDSQNQQNRHFKNKNNTSGHRGVTFDKSHKKYRANLFVNGKRIYIPPSNSLEEAIEARKQAELKYFTHSPINRTQPDLHTSCTP